MNRCLSWFLVWFTAFVSSTAVGQDTESDDGPGSRRATDRFTQQIEAASETSYVGIATDGVPIEGLYSIMPDEDVSNVELVRTAKVFLDALTEEQRSRVMFPVDAPEWRQWSNMSAYHRNGLSFDEMTEGQRDQAFQLMRTALSAKGFKLSRDIMRLNETIAELTAEHDRYSEWLYWLTVMGEPSETEPWGWQVDGHHLVINYFVLGNQVVMSPVFTGSEPVVAKSGVYKGTSILGVEREKAFALYMTLTDQQKNAALLSDDQLPEQRGIAFGRNSTELMQDNAVIPYHGVLATNLSHEQRDLLVRLIEEFVYNNREGHARIRMEEVMAHIDETYFAWDEWDTSLGSEDLFFFRIQSPVIIIEFDHQGSIALPNAPRHIPIREHIHTVLRTPNGNDYGKDLLRQHYEQHPH